MSSPAFVAWMSVIPAPAVCSVLPVSPPIWNTKSFGLVVDTPVLQGRELGQPRVFVCPTGNEGFGSNGFAVFAPDMPKATTPYHVSPVSVLVTEMVSEVSRLGAIAYHSSMNSLPPMLISAREWNVSPAVSLTEKVEASEMG